MIHQQHTFHFVLFRRAESRCVIPLERKSLHWETVFCHEREQLVVHDTRTPAQKEAMKRYVLDFHKRFPGVRIVGHNQLAAKACPSFDVPEWLESIGIKQ